jgi:hypothetical protein
MQADPIASANGIFRAILLPPIHHSVHFWYYPTSVDLGITISATACGVWLLLGLLTLWHGLHARRRSPRHADALPANYRAEAPQRIVLLPGSRAMPQPGKDPGSAIGSELGPRDPPHLPRPAASSPAVPIPGPAQ